MMPSKQTTNRSGMVSETKRKPKSIIHPNRRKNREVQPEYKAWIASLPCVVCWGDRFNLVFGGIAQAGAQRSHTQAAHCGDRGFGQKAPDNTCIPLCEEHHGHGHKESVHTLGKNFWACHGIDKEKLISELQKRYEER